MEKIQPQTIAILFTGQIRTLQKTIAAFRTNILDYNPRHCIHIYAVLEYSSDLSPQAQTDFIKHNEALFYSIFGPWVKNVIWIESKDPKLLKFKQYAVHNHPLTDHWKDYLVNRSGSLSEYYQLNVGIIMIRQFMEKHPEITYDYFMRTRCDIMIPYPITFDPLGDTPENLKKRYECIQSLFPEANEILLFCYYIESLYYPFPFPDNARFLMDLDEEKKNNYTLEMFFPPNTENDIEKLKTPYALPLPPLCHSHRQNLYYFLNGIPKEMCVLKEFSHKKKYRKGLSMSNEKEKCYWFNSENQFQSHHLKNENRYIINSHTSLEESSLYHYNPHLFDSLQPTSTLFYLCRY